MHKIIAYALLGLSVMNFTVDYGRLWVSIGAVVISCATIAILEGIA